MERSLQSWFSVKACLFCCVWDTGLTWVKGAKPRPREVKWRAAAGLRSTSPLFPRCTENTGGLAPGATPGHLSKVLQETYVPVPPVLVMNYCSLNPECSMLGRTEKRNPLSPVLEILFSLSTPGEMCTLYFSATFLLSTLPHILLLGPHVRKAADIAVRCLKPQGPFL